MDYNNRSTRTNLTNYGSDAVGAVVSGWWIASRASDNNLLTMSAMLAETLGNSKRDGRKVAKTTVMEMATLRGCSAHINTINPTHRKIIDQTRELIAVNRPAVKRNLNRRSFGSLSPGVVNSLSFSACAGTNIL